MDHRHPHRVARARGRALNVTGRPHRVWAKSSKRTATCAQKLALATLRADAEAREEQRKAEDAAHEEQLRQRDAMLAALRERAEDMARKLEFIRLESEQARAERSDSRPVASGGRSHRQLKARR